MWDRPNATGILQAYNSAIHPLKRVRKPTIILSNLITSSGKQNNSSASVGFPTESWYNRTSSQGRVGYKKCTGGSYCTAQLSTRHEGLIFRTEELLPIHFHGIFESFPLERKFRVKYENFMPREYKIQVGSFKAVSLDRRSTSSIPRIYQLISTC